MPTTGSALVLLPLAFPVEFIPTPDSNSQSTPAPFRFYRPSLSFRKHLFFCIFSNTPSTIEISNILPKYNRTAYNFFRSDSSLKSQKTILAKNSRIDIHPVELTNYMPAIDAFTMKATGLRNRIHSSMLPIQSC